MTLEEFIAGAKRNPELLNIFLKGTSTDKEGEEEER